MELILNLNSSWLLLALASFGLLLLAFACFDLQSYAILLARRGEKIKRVRFGKTEKNPQKTKKKAGKRRKTWKKKEILKEATL